VYRCSRAGIHAASGAPATATTSTGARELLEHVGDKPLFLLRLCGSRKVAVDGAT
jgi:hypothetical protein